MAGGIRRVAGVLLLLCGLLPLAGCGQKMREDFLYNFVSKEKVDLAKRYFAALQDGDIRAIENNADPQYLDINSDARLAKIVSLFPKEKPRNVSLIDANVITNTGGQTLYGVTLEYEFSHSWVLARMLLETKTDSSKVWIAGMHVWTLPHSIEEINAFGLRGKSSLHYIVLALAIFIPLFTLVTAIVAGSSYIPRRKWLWIIFILVGFGQFNLNWTTGQTGFSPLSFELLGAMYKQVGFASPIVISIGIPIGAILFWMRRPRWRETKIEDGTAESRT